VIEGRPVWGPAFVAPGAFRDVLWGTGGRMIKRIAAASLAAVLSIGLLPACADEDGDGGTTDEEIQDGKDTVNSIGDEIQEEKDAQDTGSNENG
jgi:hypothetical protein